jgi:hypothetical protein
MELRTSRGDSYFVEDCFRGRNRSVPAPCLNCNDPHPCRLRCTEEQPAKDRATPQLRPHVHGYCIKCGAEWFEAADARPNVGIFTAEQFDRITREVREHLRVSAEYAKRRKLN